MSERVSESMVEGESTSTIDVMPSSGMRSPPETTQDQAQEELQSQPSSRHHRWTAYLLSLNPYRWNPLMGWPLLITYAVLTFAQVREKGKRTSPTERGHMRTSVCVWERISDDEAVRGDPLNL